jgi:NodT family efflux transporter outer membrane factor (OMF) lipoprotein
MMVTAALRPAFAGLTWSAVCLAAGCALQPPPGADQLQQQALVNLQVPAAWAGGGALRDGAPSGEWLAAFNDPKLQALADEALRHNLDLRAAAARVDAAAAAVQIAHGALLPSVGLAARTGGKATGDNGQLSGVIVSASWEIDVWGRLRYGQRAAADEQASRQADQRFAQLSLVAALARAWFLATEALQQQRLVDDSIATATQMRSLVEQRMRVGVGSEVEVAQARVALQSYRDQALQVELAVAESRRALELLLGRYPAAELQASAEFTPLPPAAPLGVPSQLLERRPDVIAAERRVAAAFNRVGEAQAARLPRLSLTAALSSISSSVFVLQNRDNPSGGFGATLLAPIFEGGALAAQVELRSAEQQQAVAAYAQVAQRAFNEVETALARQASLAAREPVLVQGVADNARIFDLQQVRFRVGSTDQRSVSQQTLSLYSARLALLRLHTEQRVQQVQLHLALGGAVPSGAR